MWISFSLLDYIQKEEIQLLMVNTIRLSVVQRIMMTEYSYVVPIFWLNKMKQFLKERWDYQANSWICIFTYFLKLYFSFYGLCGNLDILEFGLILGFFCCFVCHK